MVLQCPF